MPQNPVLINRAPVLTLWAAVVAERLGYDRDTALTLGKAVAGLNAQSKGRSLGIFGPPKGDSEGGQPRKSGLGEDQWIELCERSIPTKKTELGLRAVVKDSPIDPADVEKYLKSKFKEHLAEVRDAMEALADSMDPKVLAGCAYSLYVRFRPSIPGGRKGWGASGELKLEVIAGLRNPR